MVDVTGFTTYSSKLAGDLSGDDAIDGTDRNILRASLGSCEGDGRFVAETDYNGNGCTDYDDYRIWYGFFKEFIASQP